MTAQALARPRKRLSAALLGLCIAGLVSGCVTKQMQPAPSQAILDARAHRQHTPAEMCPKDVLSSLSPATAAFDFRDSSLPEVAANKLAKVALWLDCNPQVSAVVVGSADSHGDPAEQRALAKARSDAVVKYLEVRGIPASRVTVLPYGRAEPESAPQLVIRATGQRW